MEENNVVETEYHFDHLTLDIGRPETPSSSKGFKRPIPQSSTVNKVIKNDVFYKTRHQVTLACGDIEVLEERIKRSQADRAEREKKISENKIVFQQKKKEKKKKPPVEIQSDQVETFK
ncbi:hypothetical protein RDWZM_009686 [Blomia tropicalis]|uniref:Uncharacterized protein n=1 Tax=Blomia tropicalis TaxID=40697 RepID=A0A9Q0RL93_BLOTA|nr:hypothetical protein RDWZM_009686 [Blomia tropicalis]